MSRKQQQSVGPAASSSSARTMPTTSGREMASGVASRARDNAFEPVLARQVEPMKQAPPGPLGGGRLRDLGEAECIGEFARTSRISGFAPSRTGALHGQLAPAAVQM